MTFQDSINNAFALGRTKALAVLLPDTCQLQPTEGTDQSFADGYIRQTPANLRTYNALTDIPCRLDPSRAFRPAELQNEPTEVLEYYIELPFDVTIEPTDTIVIGGDNYLIRKMTTLANYDITRQILIMKAGKDVDV